MTIFAQRLKEARERAGFTTAELSRRMNFIGDFVVALENDSASPTMTVLEELARKLHCDPGWLTGYDARVQEAVEIIEELIRAGLHEGECDNVDFPGEACSYHEAAYQRREKAAQTFVTNYRSPKS